MGGDALNRRRLLNFLAASPLLAGNQVLAQELRATDRLIASPREALDVFDFELAAQKNLPPAHFGYMAAGVDDEVTLRANREGFQKFQLRPRRLVDVSKVDMSTEILGVKYDTPIIVAPVGGQKAFYTGGEIDVAKAAKA